jgi:hypothetical protein
MTVLRLRTPEALESAFQWGKTSIGDFTLRTIRAYLYVFR